MSPTASEISRRRLLFGFSAVTAAAILPGRVSGHRTPPALSWHEWTKHDALALAELVRSGELSAMQVAEQTEHAVDLVNPLLNAVVEFYHDRLLPGASDDLPRGVFHGVPYFFKDVGAVEKGRVAEGSSRTGHGRVMKSDPTYITKIRQSGLNFLGRTAAPEFGTSLVTESLLNGTTHNPWSLMHSPGGSSGGSGAAVAAGILPISAANDGGGSTRIPASMCGNVGLKYTRELVHTINGGGQPLSLTSMGINSRSVRDQAAFLDAALDPERANAEPGTAGSHLGALEEAPARLKVAVSSTQWGPYEAPADARAEMHRIGQALDELGHTVDEADAAIDFRDYFRAFKVFWTAPATSRVPPERAKSMAAAALRDTNDPLLEPITRKIYQDGMRFSWDDFQWALDVNRRCTQQLDAFFEDWDLWLTPSIGQHTPRIGSNLALSYGEQSINEWWFNTFATIPYTPLCNFTGHPAISVPVAEFESGLPLGAHFMGPKQSEKALLQVAAQLERALPWFDHHPPVHVTKY